MINLNKFLPHINLKTYILSFVFFLFVILFESFVFNVSYRKYFQFVAEWQGSIFIIICLLYLLFSLICFYLFIVFSFISSWRYKIFSFIFFSLAVIYEYGYQKAFGRFSDILDIEAAISVTSEQRIYAVISYLNYLVFVPCLVYLFFLFIDLKHKRTSDVKNFILISCLISALSLFTSYNSRSNELKIERNIPTVSLSAFFQTSSDFLIWGSLLNGNFSERQSVEKPKLSVSYRPTNNVVVVVDESVRGDHLSINGYSRETTPFLGTLLKQQILHNWGVAAAAATQSHPTYDILITGLQPDELPDLTGVKIKTSPTIFQYAKAMNYKTYFFDGQKTNYWGGIPFDVQFIDEFIGVDKLTEKNQLDNWEIDAQVSHQVKKIISSSSSNFIFVFKCGNHIPYEYNFPFEAETWKPSYRFNKGLGLHTPPVDKLDEFINAYDNSLKFNIDSFFQNLVDDYTKIPNNTVILYTGDHGQTLNTTTSHGGTSKEEALVPLFIIGNLQGEVVTNFKASHFNILPTLLDLMSYPDNLIKRKYALSLLKATETDSQKRFFNPMLQHKIPFD